MDTYASNRRIVCRIAGTEGRGRKTEKDTKRSGHQGIRRCWVVDTDNRILWIVIGTPYGDKYSAICGCFFVELDRLM
jgi:hypothetical protein